jgi:hypothetical protein
MCIKSLSNPNARKKKIPMQRWYFYLENAVPNALMCIALKSLKSLNAKTQDPKRRETMELNTR